MTRSASARPGTPGLAARLPVLTAFVALAVLTTMTVLDGFEEQSASTTAAATPAQRDFESDPSDRTPMAGLIPWAAEPVWPLAPEDPVAQEQHSAPSNPLLTLGPAEWPGLSVERGDAPGADSTTKAAARKPGKRRDKAAPDDPMPTGPAKPTEKSDPVTPPDADPTDVDPSDTGSPDPEPTDGDTAPGDQTGKPSGDPSAGGSTDEGSTGGSTGGGSAGGSTGADAPASMEPSSPALVHDAGIGEVSKSTDDAGVTSLGVPITNSSSTDALDGMVATVTLTLGSADSEAPVVVKSAGGAAWTCQGAGGQVIGNERDATFDSGATITCKHTYSSNTPAPTLNLRLRASGLQGTASISTTGNDPSPENNTRSF